MIRPLSRPLSATAAGIALAALLAACGSDEPAGRAVTDTTEAGSGSVRAAPDGAVGPPGTVGQIAAVDGRVLQVRSQMSGQTAVTVTDSTTVTDQVDGSLADVRAGACVVVRTADAGTPTDQVAATSVAVAAATDAGCGSPGGPGEGKRLSGTPSELPSELPTDRPPGMAGGFGLVGAVTSVTDGGFVVEGRDGQVTVTVGGDTTYTREVTAGAAALTRGRCVRVQGDADDAGAVTATAIQVSDGVDGQCGR
ncbi:DUF5666 domain-containing protein [Nocardioides sp. LHD-245]|uniref:DUF5666 domain-containing protein n=1 Tax=Nocardioides sp. LHD-245 TaxID=3051387 RepID=UPI0027DF3BC2|nr:DUF5666 domain-containing protein [Nocardioides sp. LHD-245]